MNKILGQYKKMIDFGSEEAINNWILSGDWMLLTTNRNVLQELQNAVKLNSNEINKLTELDNRFKLMLTNTQREQFEKLEPGMPIRKWWT